MPFSDFWAIYPKKVARFDAEKAWNQQLKRGYKPDDILAGAAAFVQLVAQRGTDRTFVPHAGSWLRAGRWLDEDLRPAPGPSLFTRGIENDSGGQMPTGCGISIAGRLGADQFNAYFRGCEFTKSSVVAPTPERRDYIINKFGHLFRDIEFTTRER